MYRVNMLLEQGLNVCFEFTLGAAVHVHDIGCHHVEGQGRRGQHRGNLDVDVVGSHVDVAKKFSRPSLKLAQWVTVR